MVKHPQFVGCLQFEDRAVRVGVVVDDHPHGKFLLLVLIACMDRTFRFRKSPATWQGKQFSQPLLKAVPLTLFGKRFIPVVGDAEDIED
jgi:hypothetical protein